MKLNNKELKKLMELVKFYENKLSEIASAGDRRDREASAILEKMSDEQTSKALRELGVEFVNKDKLGIRVSALREAGITDMDKLCSMTYKQLSRVKGIGEESA